MSKVLLIGGGHVNCQVLKMLKRHVNAMVKGTGHSPNESDFPIHMTQVSEYAKSYYSGMLPGATASIYDPSQIQVELGPVAKWCNVDFIQKRVTKIKADHNKVVLHDGTVLDYDVSINVGSKTRGTHDTPGVDKYSLTTRPIDELIPKIIKKEQELKAKGITPKIVVCGAGCAGVELSFGFKNRWQKYFKKDHIETSLISAQSAVLPFEKQCLIDIATKKLISQGINLHYNKEVVEVTPEGVKCNDGTEVEGNVVVWCTGAEPQPVVEESDLDMSKGFFKVNRFLQSTSHPNVFGGGDCISIDEYEHYPRPFPPKAGVYAVREGPVLANNLIHYVKGEQLEKYTPQTEFLALLSTGDYRAIGTRYGFSFAGKWVWNMKDYIDVGFMKLFDPNNLFNDYKNKGTAEPLDFNALFEEELKSASDERLRIKDKVKHLSVEDASKYFKVSEDSEEYLEQFMILERMKIDVPFRDGMIKSLVK